MSIVFMLCGWICFGVITVSVTREFSLQAAGVRLNHTILLGSLCVALLALMTYLSVLNYDYETIDGFTLAVKIMIAQGGTIPGYSNVWDYWLADIYSIVAIPLFLFFMAHLEAEVDIGDSTGYMDNAIRTYFSEEDMGFLAIFDQAHRDKSNAAGLFQLHALLILRFRELHNMQQLVDNVNAEFGYAIKHGLVPNTSSARRRARVSFDCSESAAEDGHGGYNAESTEFDSLLPRSSQ